MTKFSKETKNGYEVLGDFTYTVGWVFHKAIIAYRKGAKDYIIALGYDEGTGEWAQGLYDFKSYKEAEQRLRKIKNVID